MTETKFLKIIFCCFILTINVWPGRFQNQPVRADSDQNASTNVGRSNPFGRITAGNKSTDQKIFASPQTYEGKPELFLETVTLKFLDAKDLEKVAAGLSSEYGAIVTNQQNNSLIICDTRENIVKILAEIEKADKTQQQIMFVETVTLKFLEASNLKNALEKMLSKYGSIAVDDNTNSLIVCDTNDNLEKILVEVKKADQAPLQIMIEVVIIDVQLKNDTEIGVDWDFLTAGNEDVAYRQSLIYPDRLSMIAPTTTTIGNTTAYQNLGFGSELSLVNDDIRNVVRLLQQKRNVDILASPRVMVVSGQKANIKTVEEIPYQELTESSGGGGGANAVTSTKFKEVGVTLDVKATLTEDGKILLDINPTQSVNTGTSIGGVPVVDKREASTKLLMDDGQVAVMGGLRRQATQIIKYQVPLLGDLPLVGFIFSDDRKVVENSELLVLLSPHVYKGEPIDEDIMDRYKQLKARKMLSIRDEQEDRKQKTEDKKEKMEPINQLTN